jgi:hypothetical protein
MKFQALEIKLVTSSIKSQTIMGSRMINISHCFGYKELRTASLPRGAEEMKE